MEIAAVFGVILAVCYLLRLLKPLGTQAVVSSKRIAADDKHPVKCVRCGQTYFLLRKDGKIRPEVDNCRWCGESTWLKTH